MKRRRDGADNHDYESEEIMYPPLLQTTPEKERPSESKVITAIREMIAQDMEPLPEKRRRRSGDHKSPTGNTRKHLVGVLHSSQLMLHSV